MGDGKLILISMTVSGINDRIRFYSYMLCTENLYGSFFLLSYVRF